MKVVSGRTMRDLDRETIDAGTPSGTLMERAGFGAFTELLTWLDSLDSRHAVQFLIVTGKGNNGGDGHVVARLLAEETDYAITVCSACDIDDLTGDALLTAEQTPEDVPFLVTDELPDELIKPGTIIIDALLGTGISGDLRKPYATLITQINASGLPVVSLDIPSGVNADDGSTANVAVQADLTITMGLPKTGLFIEPGASLSGCIRIVDIGIPDEFIANKMSLFDAITPAEAAHFLTRLPTNAHKGTMGRISIFGGSATFPGAPMLAAKGALRAGGGLVTLAYPSSIGPLLRTSENAIILQPLDDSGTGNHQPSSIPWHTAQDVLVVGPGLGQAPAALEAAATLLRSDKPTVLDADALAILFSHADLFPRLGITVLTPHPGEMARLLTAIGLADMLETDRVTQASLAATQLGVYIVLKGSRTIVSSPDGDIFVNTSGCPALATGGSGDVLAGIIGAFLAQSDDPLQAICAAVFLHGLASELAPYGKRYVIADDLPNLLGEAMHAISPFA